MFIYMLLVYVVIIVIINLVEIVSSILMVSVNIWNVSHPRPQYHPIRENCKRGTSFLDYIF